MKLFSKRSIVVLIIAVILAEIIAYMPGEMKSNRIKIGVSDDTSGLVFDYMIYEKGLKELDIMEQFETYPIKDCCTSNAQWALSGDLLDVAILCPSAAELLLEKDDRFEILGPAILNSDILVTKEGVSPKKVGVTQNRLYQNELVKKAFKEDCEIVPMLGNALPYALEKGTVDGIIVDILKGIKLKGDKYETASDKDVVSYVLVVRKKFKQDKRFIPFMEAYRASIEELNDMDVLLNQINRYKKWNLGRKEMEEWQRLKTRLVFITEQEE